MLKVLLKSTALVLLLHAISPLLQAMETDENDDKKVSKRMPSDKKEEGEKEGKELALSKALNSEFNMDENATLPKGWSLMDSAKNRDISKPISLKKKPIGVELLGDNYTFYTNVPALKNFDNTTFTFNATVRSTNPGVCIQYYDGKNAVTSNPYASKKGEWETLNIEFNVDGKAKFHRLYSAILGAVKGNPNPSVDIKNVTLKKKPIGVELLGDLTVRSGREVKEFVKQRRAPSDLSGGANDQGKNLVPSLPDKLHNYLSTSKKPILLFGCGHARWKCPHKGVFTIDFNASMGPDICKPITASLLTHMAENGGEGKFHLIWEENLNLGVINKNLTEPLYKLLAKGGYLAFKEVKNEFDNYGHKLEISTIPKEELLFIDSVKETFKDLKYVHFDDSIPALQHLLSKNQIITPIGNGDWDYSKVKLQESSGEKIWFCGLEDWNKVIQAKLSAPCMDLGIDFNKAIWPLEGNGSDFKTAVWGLKWQDFAFIENNSVYVKFIISTEKLNRMISFDKNRKILYEIDPMLANYRNSVYIAQKK